MFDKSIRIETNRLLIRPFTLDDKDSIFNLMKDKDMYSFTPDEPWESIEDAEAFLELVLWLYDLNHETFRHFFAITLRENGSLIGFCGVGGIDYDRTQNEIFYHIGRNYWGRGYATEAAKAMLEYYFVQLGQNRIIGAVHPENAASNIIMEKIGLNRTGTISGLPEEHAYYNGEYLYSLHKDEYLSKYRGK